MKEPDRSCQCTGGCCTLFGTELQLGLFRCANEATQEDLLCDACRPNNDAFACCLSRHTGLPITCDDEPQLTPGEMNPAWEGDRQ